MLDRIYSQNIIRILHCDPHRVEKLAHTHYFWESIHISILNIFLGFQDLALDNVEEEVMALVLL